MGELLYGLLAPLDEQCFGKSQQVLGSMGQWSAGLHEEPPVKWKQVLWSKAWKQVLPMASERQGQLSQSSVWAC